MNACPLHECQASAGCAHRGPKGEFCYGRTTIREGTLEQRIERLERRATKLVQPHAQMLRDLVANAIATERERCAQIAEGFNAAGKPIAKAIRELP